MRGAEERIRNTFCVELITLRVFRSYAREWVVDRKNVRGVRGSASKKPSMMLGQHIRTLGKSSLSPPPRISRRSSNRKVSHSLRWLPAYLWQSLTRRAPRGLVHVIVCLADHFEPGIVPEDGQARAPYDEQERRLERWCLE